MCWGMRSCAILCGPPLSGPNSIGCKNSGSRQRRGRKSNRLTNGIIAQILLPLDPFEENGSSVQMITTSWKGEGHHQERRRSKGGSLEIGAAWPHRDGKGYGVKLDVIPRSPNAQLVIRAVEPKPAAGLASVFGGAAGRTSFRFCRNENAVCRNTGDPGWIRTSDPQLRRLTTAKLYLMAQKPCPHRLRR